MRSTLYIAIFIFGLSAAYAAELNIPALKGTPGNTLEVPVMIDEIENLAGIKMVMTYDAEILIFKKAAKTRHTTSLMHIVNAKKPGLLIIVMAGARGIKGKGFNLLTLTFQVKQDVKTPGETVFKITDVQLMSDKLKAIKASVRVHPMQLVSDGGAKRSTNSQNATHAKTQP